MKGKIVAIDNCYIASVYNAIKREGTNISLSNDLLSKDFVEKHIPFKIESALASHVLSLTETPFLLQKFTCSYSASNGHIDFIPTVSQSPKYFTCIIKKDFINIVEIASTWKPGIKLTNEVYASLGVSVTIPETNIRITPICNLTDEYTVFSVSCVDGLERVIFRGIQNGENVILQPHFSNLNTFKIKQPSIKTDLMYKKWISIGDSITWQDKRPYSKGTELGKIARGYQTLIEENLGLAPCINEGRSGQPLTAMSGNAGHIKDYDYTKLDLVIFLCGTNDYRLDVPLGELGSVDKDVSNFEITFYHAYRYCIEYILTQNPSIKILLCTPMQRSNGGYDSFTPNSKGYTLLDYRKAIFDVGEMYGLPVVDLFRDSGFNKKTYDFYTVDKDGLHPNDLGYERIANILTSEIERVSRVYN